MPFAPTASASANAEILAGKALFARFQAALQKFDHFRVFCNFEKALSVDVAQKIFVRRVEIARIDVAVCFHDEPRVAMAVHAAKFGGKTEIISDEIVQLSFADEVARKIVLDVERKELSEEVSIFFRGRIEVLGRLFGQRPEAGNELKIFKIVALEKSVYVFDVVCGIFG